MAYERNDRRYERDRYGYDDDQRGGRDDRGFFERAGDEVRSWFGDEDAERRRMADERFDERVDRSDPRRDYGRGGYSRGGDYARRDVGGYRSPDAYPRWYRSNDSEFRRSYQQPAGYGYDQDVEEGRQFDTGAGYRGRTSSHGAGYDRDAYVYGGGSRTRGDRGIRDADRFGDASHGEYRGWRDRQLDAFDRDYDEYQRENRSRFESEFAAWRQNRQTQRDSLRQVKEHQEVVGADGTHVGTIDHVRGDHVLLTKSDPDAGGHHHAIPSSWIASVDDRVHLSKTAAEAKAAWQDTEERGGLFGDGDRDAGRRGGNLNRSFSGTY